MPVEEVAGRQMFTCTRDDPWNEEKVAKDMRVRHPDAAEGDQHDGWPGGDTVDYRCPHCGLKFSVELPQ